MTLPGLSAIVLQMRRLARRIVLPPIRAVRVSRWTAPRPVEALSPGPLVITGFQDEVIGLGRGAQLMIAALSQAGLAPLPDPIRPILQHFPRAGRALSGNDGGVWILIANAPECDACLQALAPESWAGRYRIAYWAWETTQAPLSWARTARWFHEIWTPSRFVADALTRTFARAGSPELSARLRVHPHPPPRLSAVSDRPRFALPERALVVLTSFDGRSSFARKNPSGAIRAWLDAFPTAAEDQVLAIKTLPASTLQPEWRAIAAMIEGRPDVRVICDELDDGGMAALFASTDLVLSLHRSEGFGLQIFEAMSLGKTVMATAYSAPVEFIDDRSAILIPAREVPVHDPSGVYSDGHWGEPDLEVAAARLREIAADRSLLHRRADAACAAVDVLDATWSKAVIDAEVWRALVD